MRKAGYIVLTFRFEEENRRWVAICDELGTSTFGRSLPEADKKLQEAVTLHLNTLEEVGEIERFFKENKIKFHPTKPKDDIHVCVPAGSTAYIHPFVQPLGAFSGV